MGRVETSVLVFFLGVVLGIGFLLFGRSSEAEQAYHYTNPHCKEGVASPEGFNCMTFLKDFPSYSTFGGHAQAAGFSLSPQDYTAFKKYIHDQIQTFTWEEPDLETLVVLPEELTLSAIQSLDQLRPFGPGFRCPSFELIQPTIESISPIQNGKHVRYVLINGLECMN